jgi:hypothetical protein
MAETQIQVLQENPEIEAARIQLLNDARAQVQRGLTPVDFQTAGFSDLQSQALGQSPGLQGNFEPYLTAASQGVGDAQQALGGIMSGAQPYQQLGSGFYQQAGNVIPNQLALTGDALTSAQQYALGQAQQGQQALALAGQNAQNLAQNEIANQRLIANQLPGAVGSATDAMGQASTLGLGSFATALQGSQGAVDRGRNITSEAATALQRAGALGEQAALSGIAQLGDTTNIYDPASARSFSNEFEDAAVQQALADIARAGNIQRQGIAANAVSSGAFGGSRQAVAEQELGRNVLEQQGRTAAQMRQAGFEAAQARAQDAFERQQGRALQAATSTGALGAQGSSALANSAQSAGALGLDAERLASGQSLQGGQLGVSTAQLAGNLGLQSGELGLQGLRSQSDIENRAAALGISSQELLGRLAQQQAALGQSQAQLEQTGALQQGQLGLQGAQQLASVGQGLGSLGSDFGRLGISTAQQQAQAGAQQAALGDLQQSLGQRQTGFLFDLGRQQQQQQQAQFDTARQNEQQQRFNEMQQLGYLSDIYAKTPSSQMSFSQNVTPSPSVGQQALGLGISGLSAAAGAAKAGLF